MAIDKPTGAERYLQGRMIDHEYRVAFFQNHPRPQSDRDFLVEGFAMELARYRCNGQVYMDGSHNPKPSEERLAKQLVEMVEQVLNIRIQ